MRHARKLSLWGLTLGLALACCGLTAAAEKKPQPPAPPKAGPRATPLRITWLYIQPDTGSQKVSKVQIGREMVIVQKSGPWLQVYANTDIQESPDKDAPLIGQDDTPTPISGWMQARGIVTDSTPNADQILMGAAANEEALAADPHGPANAAQSARLLYQRLADMFPNSPLAPQAAWRSADIRWQLQKADLSTLGSSRERDPFLREQMDEDALRKVVKRYPGTRWAALAAFDLIDNKLCGDWQGSPKCPAKESEYYEKYADQYPDGPRTAQALYLAAYRQAVLKDMFAATGDKGKSEDAHNRARALADRLKAHFPDTDYALRAQMLVFKLDQNIPVYGIDLN